MRSAKHKAGGRGYSLYLSLLQAVHVDMDAIWEPSVSRMVGRVKERQGTYPRSTCPRFRTPWPRIF
jgi:hypothetical protein